MSATAALDAGMKPYCRCQHRTLGGLLDLCEHGPMPTTCECIAVSESSSASPLLCTKPWTALHSERGGEPVFTCSVRYFRPNGKSNGKCSGYQRPQSEFGKRDASSVWRFTPGEHPVEGELSHCSDCYDPPLHPAVPGAPCSGYRNGTTEHGTFSCW